MSEPTRQRATAGDLAPAVVKSPPAPAARPDQTMRSFVYRDVVDRRTGDRRGGPPSEPREHRAARAIAQPDPDALLQLDERLRSHVEAEIERAHRAGLAAGYEQGRSDAIATTESLAAAISLATTELVDYAAAEKAAAVNAVIELAERVATVVMNRTPHDGGRAALERIREVLEGLDDGPFTIAVHPDDLDAVGAALGDDRAMVAPDPSLRPGEARIRGVWSYAELTQAAAWDAVRTALAL